MSATLRLVWKEYRVLRGFWIALALFGLMCDGLVFLLVENQQDRLPGLFALVAVLPACFAVGAGATLFALEREEATRDLLRYLPLTSMRIFVGKVIVALGGVVTLTMVMLAAALGGVWLAFGNQAWTTFAERTTLIDAAQAVFAYFIFVLPAMGWSVFFSLRTSRPLLAAVLGAVSALGGVAVVQFAAMALLDWSPQKPWAIPAAHLAAIAVIFLVDMRVANTWLHGRRIVARMRPEVVRSSPIGRLVWQELRRSYRLLLVLLAIGIVIPSLNLLYRDPRSAVPVAGFVLALLGACTFLGDQENSQFRFFAERGISARTVWLSRELFWGGAALLLAAGLWLAHLLAASALGDHFAAGVAPSSRPILQFLLSWVAIDIGPGGFCSVRSYGDVIGMFLWISLSFGAGQLCSMFFRSGLLAAVFGVMLASVLLVWTAFMQVLAIGWWWSVAPLAVALFAATRLRSAGWILQRRGFRAWLSPAMVLAIPALTLLAAVPAYRVFVIPSAEADLSVADVPPIAAENEDVRRFQRACERLQLRPTSQVRSSLTDPYNSEPTETDRQWLNEKGAALDEVVATSLRLPVDGTIASGSPRAVVDWQELAAMMLAAGQLAEAEDDLDGAWLRYRAVLNLARFLRRGNGATGEALSGKIEAAAEAQMLRWGSHKQQTVKRLRAALDNLNQLDKQDPPLAEVVRRECQGYFAQVDEIQADPGRLGHAGALVVRWAPWEVARTRRVLRYVFGLCLLDAQDADRALALPGAPFPYPAREYELRHSYYWKTSLIFGLAAPSTKIIDDRQSALCHRRATELALAAEAWRIEHGVLPKELTDLVDEYFVRLPVDPFGSSYFLSGRIVHGDQPFWWFPYGLKAEVRSHNVARLPAGTPLIFSPSRSRVELDYFQLKFERLKRNSADDPIAKTDLPDQGVAAPAAITKRIPSGGAPGAMGGGAGMVPAPGGAAGIPGGGAAGAPMGGMMGGGMFPAPPGAGGMGGPAGIGPAPGVPENAVPVPAVEHLDGLVFPIPNAQE
jgi:ABC-type transport system involved in multi-copper enzyme maturation permease subunit